VISAFPKNHDHGTAWNTCFPGGYSGFQVTGMTEWWQKSKPKKIPRASKEPKKSLDQKLTPQNPMPNFRASKISKRYQEFTTTKGNSSEAKAG